MSRKGSVSVSVGAKMVNRDIVDAAAQYVYGTDDGQRSFIERYLRKEG